jgi:hypothetical protein
VHTAAAWREDAGKRYLALVERDGETGDQSS